MLRRWLVLAIVACHGCAGQPHPPETGSWKTMSPGPVFAPSAFESAWTGSEMLVWGRRPGLCDPSQPPPCIGAVGGRYDPSTDRWRAISLSGLPSGFFSGRTEAPGVWTGKEMLIWGGNCPESVVCNGGVA